MPPEPDEFDDLLDGDAEAAPLDDADEDASPDQRCFTVKRNLDKRLDVYLRGRLKGVSRAKVQQLIDLGGIHVNGKIPKSSYKIRAGDVIDIILPARATRTIEPEDIPLDILFEDDDLIVVNKQADLIVHPARSHLYGTLLNALAFHFKKQAEAAGLAFRSAKTRGFKDDAGKTTIDNATPVEGLSEVGAKEFRPGIIHRLDRHTTGCIVLAKSDQAHWAVARQFEHRTCNKAYLAVVHGNFAEPGGVIDQPLGKHPTIREAQAVRHDSLGKKSVTLYRVREQYKGYSLVELELKTGRTHQIRVHLTWMGYPIAGDIIYGGNPIGPEQIAHPPNPPGERKGLTFARDKTEGDRLESAAAADDSLIIRHPALHAGLLEIHHPIREERMTFTAPLHEPMATLVRELRKHRIDAPVATEGYWINLDEAIRDVED